MKNIFTTLSLVFISVCSLYSQVPEAFSYQAVVRNSSGEIISNQNVTFQISILQESESGTAIYVETHSVATNEFGLANLKIGKGTPVSGVFSPAGWGTASHFLKVEIDPEGGTSFIEMGTTQLLSVPYAFHAQTVENDQVNDADADPTNEIQTLGISGTQLTLSGGGGTVPLPSSEGSSSDDWGTQTVVSDATLDGDGTTANPLSVVGSLTDNQTLSISGNELSILDGNTVALPSSNLWTQNGSEIYFNNNVGIGTTDPLFNLDVIGNSSDVLARLGSNTHNAYMFIERGGSSKGASIIYKTGGIGTFYTGLLGSSSYKISTKNPALNGLEVEIDGDVVLSDELHSASEGSSNMMPFAYGYVKDDGTKSSGTSNIGTVTKLSTGQYKVEIEGFDENDIVVVTPNAGFSYLTGTVIGKSSGYFVVAIWDTKNDAYKNGGFSFIVYKP